MVTFPKRALLVSVMLLLLAAAAGCGTRLQHRFAQRSPADKPGIVDLAQTENGRRSTPPGPAAHNRSGGTPPRSQYGARAPRSPQPIATAPVSRPAYLTPNISAVSAGPEAPRAVSGPTFEELIADSELPVMVDCWAPWCGPCKRMLPVVDELAEEFSGRAVVAKLNIDADPQVKERYGIKSIPAFLFFKDGQLVDRVTGAAPKSELERRLATLAPRVQTVRRETLAEEAFAADAAR